MLARVLPKAVEAVGVEEGEEVAVEAVEEVVEDQEQEEEVAAAVAVAVQPPLGAVQQLLQPLEVRREEQGRRRQQQGLEGGLSGHRQSGGEAASSFLPPDKHLLFPRS